MHIKNDVVDDIDLFERGKIFVELEPNVFGDLAYFGADLFFVEFGVLIAGHEQEALQQIFAFVSGPVPEFAGKDLELDIVNHLFDALLQHDIVGSFPGALEMRDHGWTERKEAVLYVRVYRLIGIIEQSNKSAYLFFTYALLSHEHKIK